MALKAYVLITTDPNSTPAIVRELQKVPEVRVVNEVMGPYDIVAEIEIARLEDMTTLLRERIRTVEGIRGTVTCVTLS